MKLTNAEKEAIAKMILDNREVYSKEYLALAWAEVQGDHEAAKLHSSNCYSANAVFIGMFMLLDKIGYRIANDDAGITLVEKDAKKEN